MAFTSLSYSFLYFSNNSPSSFFFCQTILFFTSNECFSDISHFVSFSQAHLKITLKTKTFGKTFDFIEFRILRYVLHCSISLERDLKIQKLIKGGNFFFKKNNRGGEAHLFGTLEYEREI